ncbi:MAG: hypothetical protein ACLFPQ_06730 [Candidatus Woesearchaeota archaeon]
MSSIFIKYIKCSNCGYKFKAFYAQDIPFYSVAVYNKKENKIENIDPSEPTNNNYIDINKETINQIPCPKCNKKKLEIISKRIFY